MTADQTPDDAFLEALEDCRARVQRGEPLATCLERHPGAYHDEITALLAVGERVALAAPEPSAAFVGALEPRLLAAVDDARAADRARVGARGPVGRLRALGDAMRARSAVARAAVVALIAALVLAGSGIAVVEASSSALPGEPLYQVTRLRETVELWLARSESARLATVQAHLARRTRELERAAARQAQAARVAEAERNLVRDMRQLVDRALHLRQRGDQQAIGRVLVAVRMARARVAELAARAPDPERRASFRRLDRFLAAQERRLQTFAPASPRGATRVALRGNANVGTNVQAYGAIGQGMARR